MPIGVITAVEAMAEAEGQPLIVGGCPLFEWRPDNAISDENDGADDEDHIYDEYVYEDDVDDEDEFDNPAYVDEEEPDLADRGETDITHNSDADTDSVGDEADASTSSAEQEVVPTDEDKGATARKNEGATATMTTEKTNPTNSEATAEENQGATTAPKYTLRGNRRSYSYRFGHDSEPGNFQLLQHAATRLRSTPADMHTYIVGHVMHQMTANAGFKKHGEKAVNAIFEEFCQLDEKSVFAPVDATTITNEQKRKALRAINLIKEKRCGKLKGRTCADGRPQRGQYTKEETASPTVSNDALMLSLMIDALEKRDVATADVVGAYLLADMDEFVLLKLTGDAVTIMCQANDRYSRFVTTEHGQRVLYLQLLKALYGCVRSALLWYDLFSSTLKNMGFVLNPYDPCVANKTIDGSQCTILWYVDDTKISHVKASVTTAVILAIEQKFGKMTVTRGKEHVFLGMQIAIKDDGTVQVKMGDYVREAITDFGEVVTRSAATPARKTLFNVNTQSPALDKDKADRFHRIVAKLLYISKRCRLDIQLAVAFLCTRVSCSTEEDWGKLRRTLQYLHRTVDEFLILGADSLTAMRTFVDAAYGVHSDMKSHTGGCISFGRWTVLGKSSKQKLNTKSSTEAELVGASDYIPNTIWVKMFLAHQGHHITDNVFCSGQPKRHEAGDKR
jgi:hypothetical protein